MLKDGELRRVSSAADNRRILETVGTIKPAGEMNSPPPAELQSNRAVRWLIGSGAAISCGIALLAVSTGWWRDWRIGTPIGLVAILLLLGNLFATVYSLRRIDKDLLTAKRAAETQLRSLAERLALVARHANDILLVLDEDKRIVDANDRALAAYGYTLEELRRLPLGGLRSQSARANLSEQLELLGSADGTVFETVHQRKDGTVFPVEVSGRSIEIGGHRFTVGIYRDLTQRKAYEREIERLKQLYSALSHVNQAIMRVDTREELLTKVCQALVGHCDFKGVWIGWVKSATLPVEMVAQAGDELGLLKNITVFVDDRPEGHGPAGTCIREGRVYVCNDFANDPRTKPWREAALRAGISASVALPIIEHGVVRGALMAYAVDKDYFGPREITLLEETVADVTFALEYLEVERQRTEAEAALRESEDKFKYVFEHSPSGKFITLPSGAVFVNRALCDMLGYTKAELETCNWQDIVHPDDVEMAKELLEPVLAGRREKVRFDARFLHKKGVAVWADVSTSMRRDAVGEPLHFITTVNDITERIRAEAALRASTEQLAAAMDQALLAHWEKDAATATYTFNDRFYALYGTTAEREGGYRMPEEAYAREFMLPEERHIVTDNAALLSAGVVTETQVEHRIRRRDGKLRHMFVRITTVRDASGRIVGTRGVNQDITERKLAEEELRKLSRIIEQAPLSVVITDLSGAIEYVNPRFCTVTGYTPEEVLGRNPRMLQSGQTASEVYRDMWQKITHDEIWSGGLCNRKKNGELYVEMAVIAPVVDKNGRATHYVGLKDDITAQRRFAEEIEAKLRKEQEISEMKTRFISMISHEFRTPLTAAMASAELLHNHFDRLAPAKREELFGRIHSSVLRLTEMLDEILTLNRVDTGHSKVQLEPADLPSLLNDAIDEIRLSDHDAHRFEFIANGDQGSFITDANLLRHIVSNLLSNAARYSPAGTAITIRTEADSQGIKLSVADRGIGIPEADRERIFESFERGSNVGAAKGTGLGLNIVKRMTELLGGSISVDSVEGGGSRFALFLPRINAPANPS
jgi:PAS domain S-box-containing protein